MDINKKDNSIHIGNKNNIKYSVIGNDNFLDVDSTNKKEPWYSKLFWKLFIPIAVIIIAAAICLWLGLR